MEIIRRDWQSHEDFLIVTGEKLKKSRESNDSTAQARWS